MEITPLHWQILYRGSLDSCNYDCSYCPFAKKKNSREELAYDRTCLERFTHWVSQRKETIRILFTPWGEGLIRKYYQQELTRLSHLSNVQKVVIQTNLSCSLNWIDQVNKGSFALWVTYHPQEVSFDNFIKKCHLLIKKGIQFSVGVVGMKEHFEAIEKLKIALSERYIWINAYKREANYYTENEETWLTQMDQLFPFNNKIYKTLDKKCSAGHTSFSVDGEGTVFPCHFIKKPLGNIYKDDIKKLLRPKSCVNNHCSCYIGYINLEELEMEKSYGDRILERIPVTFNPLQKGNLS